ncbi:helix-turn-helix domain-containing protein [Terribacillus sp. DMT04]|uniref:helix-turn-helix domain-containing protein n=1 Tax=Terribacillus sp. DMT04 TaxID=2850441 RepID=UPI001C2BD8C5|nr:helix-turn-helix domain-containing protein [Terribacillus sp. DMT04]QXE03160.1 helix-turn-helix domain-containing protein [Terribacillus sp. DMT04]
MDIGAKLREARESKGMTLEDVQQRTKIQKRYLKAIEENNHSVMPGDFYTRAFIKEYAQTVGVNPDDVLEPKQQETAAAPVQEEREAPSRQERSQARENDRPPRRERKGIPYLSSIIIGLLVIAAIVVVVLVYAGGSNETNENNTASETQQPNEDQVVQPNDEQTAEEEADESADTEEQTDQAAEEQQQKEEEAAEPKLSVAEEGTASNPVTTYTLENAGEEVTLTLAAEGGDAWLQVGDGSSAGNVYTGTIAAGSEPVEQDVSDLETVTVRTGYSKATKLQINGQALDFPIDNDVQTIVVNIQK